MGRADPIAAQAMQTAVGKRRGATEDGGDPVT